MTNFSRFSLLFTSSFPLPSTRSDGLPFISPFYIYINPGHSFIVRDLRKLHRVRDKSIINIVVEKRRARTRKR